MTDILPILNATPTDIQPIRAVTVFRFRETQPGINQAQQRSVPHTASGDTG